MDDLKMKLSLKNLYNKGFKNENQSNNIIVRSSP
jgi:hypothetical protein